MRYALVFFSISLALFLVVSNAVMAQTASQASTASTVLSKQEPRQQDRQDCTKQAAQQNIAGQNLADFYWGCMVPILAPMAHAQFCLQFQEDCEVHGIDFRHRNIALTIKRWNELNTINDQINHNIFPQASGGAGLTQEWLVSPPTGNCNDYAVTKRHELLALGWPSRALLLAQALTASGEHHLLLIVRMKDINLVLDNLAANIWPVERVAYRWERVQTPQNPKFWLMVSEPGQIRIATLPDQHFQGRAR